MENNNPRPFLKQGQGKLASDYHGETKFSLQRKKKIIEEQIYREKFTSSPSSQIKLQFISPELMNLLHGD